MANLKANDGYEVVLMQGSGTFAVESVLGSVVPAEGKLLVLANGAYGERLAQMAALEQAGPGLEAPGRPSRRR